MDRSIYLHGSSEEEQKRLSTLNSLLNESCTREMNIQFGERIIDVGSGLGQFTYLMAEQAGPMGYVLGIERDEDQYRAALKRKPGKLDSAPVEFRMGDAYRLPLTHNEWESFDIAHCRFVLEHVPHPSKVLGEMIKSVKKGGKVVASDDDHSLLRITPQNSKIDRLWEVYSLSFDKLGNDPYIGKKLVSYMYALGLRQIKNNMIFFGSSYEQSSFRNFAYNFIKVIEGAKQVVVDSNLMSSHEFDDHLSQLDKWSERPDAAIWYSLCWAEGIKV